ncbi:hypothetical protein BIU82_02010 [Arthrobacter sp. SW1]|nr:hypothetical protein BIU82_02010 [Arthrobacter sp. SW1]
MLFGEILDGAFQTIRRNPASMLGSALLGQCMVLLLSATLVAGSIGLFVAMDDLDSRRMDDEAFSSLAGPILSLFAGALGVTLLASFLLAILGGVMAVPVSRSALNRKTGFKQMWALVRHRLLALTGLAALLLLIQVLPFGLLALLAVAIITAMGPAGILIVLPLGLGAAALTLWLYIKLLVAPPALAIEELGVLESMRRSWSLTTASWWRTFGIVLVAWLIVGVIGQVVQFPLGIASGGISAVVSPHASPEQDITTFLVLTIVSMVVAALIAAVGFAFQTAISALLYVDMRMRRDGLDVELLRMLETGSDPDGVPGRGHSARPGNWPGNSANGYPTA